MAKKMKKRRHNKRTIPVAVVLGFLPLATTAISDFQAGGINGLRNTATAVIPYSPANRRFTTARLHLGLNPILAGFLVHKLAGMMGINRAIAQAGVPLIRL